MTTNRGVRPGRTRRATRRDAERDGTGAAKRDERDKVAKKDETDEAIRDETRRARTGHNGGMTHAGIENRRDDSGARGVRG